MNENEAFWKDNDEYGTAYKVIQYAMTICGDLDELQGVLQKAAVFVNEELDDLADTATDIGLTKWIKEKKDLNDFIDGEELDDLISGKDDPERQQGTFGYGSLQ